MDKVFILQMWEYHSYSYDGIREGNIYVHASESGARDHAKSLGLNVVYDVQNPNRECSLIIEEVLA